MDDTTPATKADLQTVKVDLKALEDRLLRVIEDSHKETRLYFDVRTEQLANDFRDIFNDRTVDLVNARHDHERRIRRLENRAGIFS